jgi:lipopolysaccharide transport system ATP-binding protein
MSDILIKAEGVSKKFCKSLKQSMRYGMQDIAKTMFGVSPQSNQLRDKEFWAVDDISFELKRGECLGLIGSNGSGKSTLLKMLNGIIEPDKGRIQINGKIGALIEVGAGFHPMLTGRENIYINGSILGFSKKEMDRKFDAIVEFAELDEFIDTPVKHYSSGMYVRLGFAVAAQMKPDVLLIDEVLAVGDIAFKTKCYHQISKLIEKAAVIFVSHSMSQLSMVASRVLLIEQGSPVILTDDVQLGINEFYKISTSRLKSTKKTQCFTDGTISISEVEVLNSLKEKTRVLPYGEKFFLNLTLNATGSGEYLYVEVIFVSSDLVNVLSYSSFDFGKAIKVQPGSTKIIGDFGAVILNPGKYDLKINVRDRQKRTRAKIWDVISVRVEGNYSGFAPIIIDPDWEIEPY